MKEQTNYSALKEHVTLTQEGARQEAESAPDYEFKETRELVQLVHEAADVLRSKGELAFIDFRTPGSRWRQEENYIFVLDTEGNMLVHPDPKLEGKNELSLKDPNGKYIISGLLGAATAYADKAEGWYQYQWPVPGGLIPRWKSTYVQLVKVQSGERYVVGSGMYNDRMERVFVADMVNNAVRAIEGRGKEAFPLFRDPTGPYIAKDAYIFVTDLNGVELVNPAFPNLEGRDLLDLKDTNGKYVNRELLEIIRTRGSGWSDYMWPKPGESASSRKSAYVCKAMLRGEQVMVGCGVYLADAPRDIRPREKMKAPELMALVRDAAELLKAKGEAGYPEFRKKGSKWLRDDIYLFVFTMDGIRAFHAVEPDTERRDDRNLTDIIGRPIVKMILEAGGGAEGEGWVHYMYPEPGNIFPAWKSSFVKRVTFPSGKDYVVGSGIYNMDLDKTFVEDIVNRAADLVAERGEAAFDQLRDKKGSFSFMDTYVFVERPDGTELVNGGQPSLEGKNLLDLRDLEGRAVVRNEIAAVMKEGSAWMESYWYKPGGNKPALKHTFLRKVQWQDEVYVVGSGLYSQDGWSSRAGKPGKIHKIVWKAIEEEKLSNTLRRQMVFGEKATIARMFARPGDAAPRHAHPNEEYVHVLSGSLTYIFDDRQVELWAGEALVVPSNIPHAIITTENTEFLIFFVPQREDWLRGEDQYLRRKEEHTV